MSAFSPLKDRNTEYAHIQKEIQALEAAIRALKVRHNTLSSISRLPPELLSRIFESVARGEDNIRMKNLEPRWIGVSHVCSHWRHVALENPRLWSHIQCYPYPRWALEMLKRSKMTPITVDGDANWATYPCDIDQAVTAALEQLPRIENLTLTARGTLRLEKYLSSLSGTAPLLHTFQIITDIQAMLPDNIFSGPGGAPQLRCLSLDGFNFNWKLRSLTHLTVVRVPTGFRLSVNELIMNLGYMPQLESIHLSSVMVPPRDSELNASSPSTHLPSIARIHLEDDLMSCLAFFTKFTYPNTAVVSIGCFCPHRLSDDVTPVRDLITVINTKNIVPITSLWVENTYYGTFRGRDSQGISRVSVGFQDVMFQPSSISWDSLSLHHLKSLRVIGTKIRQSVWLRVFGKLKNLRTIRIIDHADNLLDVLTLGIPQDPAGAHTTVTNFPGRLNFKALKSLSLSGTLGEHYGERPWVDMLALCFRERRRRGLTLRRLSIEGHGDGAVVVRRLGCFVKHVKWSEVFEVEISDGEVEDYNDEDDEDE